MLDLSLCEVAVLFCGKEGSEAPRCVLQTSRPPCLPTPKMPYPPIPCGLWCRGGEASEVLRKSEAFLMQQLGEYVDTTLTHLLAVGGGAENGHDDEEENDDEDEEEEEEEEV